MMSGDHNGPMSTKWCLVVDDGIDLWSSNVDGAPFPQEQLTRINPISRGCTPRLRMVITVVLLAEILTLSMQKYWVHSKSLKYNLPSTFPGRCIAAKRYWAGLLDLPRQQRNGERLTTGARLSAGLPPPAQRNRARAPAKLAGERRGPAAC